MKVKATKRGYYGKFRYEGDVFTISGEKKFSPRWMEKVEPDKPKTRRRKAAQPTSAPEPPTQPEPPQPDALGSEF